MMKSMIAENGVTFKGLEKNIYSLVCEIGREFTAEFLERYDRKLMEERDKHKYRHKGLRRTTIKTVYGEVTYHRDSSLFRIEKICMKKICQCLLDSDVICYAITNS